jgi:Phage integrase family
VTTVRGLPADALVFNVPAGLRRILDHDLRAAGIPKRDERGRTVDVHALRHTFGTLLSKGGVTPRTAQAAMRHSTIDLTMNTYTDPKLLDVAGAVEALPALPLFGGRQTEGIAAKATGTDDLRASQFAPGFAPTAGKQSTLWSSAVQHATDSQKITDDRVIAASAYSVKRNDPLTSAVNGSSEWAARGSNSGPLPCEDSALTN